MARVITSVSNPNYKALRRICGNRGTHNGAYYYSMEIEKNIAPLIETDRPIDTLGMRGVGSANHAIVFLHHNVNHDRVYKWLKKYDDLVLVVSSWATYAWAQQAGYKVIYLPLSIDVSYVEKFSTAKTKKACYAGNKWAFKLKDIRELVPDDVDFPPANLERDELLKFIAPYKKCYAIGRCALEAKVLGCEVLKCDSRYDPDDFPVLDSRNAAKMLQQELDRIDGKRSKMVIDTNHPCYIAKRNALKGGQFNGAYYYSQEIVKNIIPNVETDRPWDTLTMRAIGTVNGAICFLHQCIEMDKAYDWLKDYEDLVLVVSSPYVYDWAAQNGYKAIYLPLSIDTEYVKQFKKKRRTKNACFCGNIWKFREQEIAETIPDDVDFQPPNICREDLLKFMSDYKYVYAIGRCALEAQALGAEILQCYKKFPVEHWKLIDNKEAAKKLQHELDQLDKK